MATLTLRDARFSLGPVTHTKDPSDGNRIVIPGYDGMDEFPTGSTTSPFDIKRAVTGWSVDGDTFHFVVDYTYGEISKAILQGLDVLGVNHTVVTDKKKIDPRIVATIKAYVYIDDSVALCMDASDSLRVFVNLAGKGLERAAAPKGKKLSIEEQFWTDAYKLSSEWSEPDRRNVTKFTPGWENVYKYRDYYYDIKRDTDGRFTAVKVTYVERPKPRCAGPAYAFVGSGNEWGQPAVVPASVTPLCPSGVEIAAVESKYYIHPAIASQSMFMSQQEAEDFVRRLGGH